MNEKKGLGLLPSTKKQPFFTHVLRDMLQKGDNPLEIIFMAQYLSALVGFDFVKIEQVTEKLIEEVDELKDELDRAGDELDIKTIEELGDVIFSWINVCRHIGVDPVRLSRANAAKYTARCRFIEQRLRKEGITWRDLDQDEIVEVWNEAKDQDIGKEEFRQVLDL